MVNMQVELYTDGSCSRNPGTGGLAYIIRYFESDDENGLPQAKQIEFTQGYRLTTNNRMEIMAGILGMQKILDIVKEDASWSQVRQVNLQTDSEYFCKGINLKWVDKWKENNWYTSGFGGKAPQPVKNKDLWEQVLALIDELKKYQIIINFNWVKGHNGNELNEACDKLAVESSNGNYFIKDTVYEQLTDVKNRR